MNMPGEQKQDHSRRYAAFLKAAKTAIYVLAAILVIFLIIFLAQRAYSLGYETASYKPVDSESQAREITVTINSQMSASDIGKMLIEEGLVDESLPAFLLQDILSGLHGEYVPGTYTLNTSQSVDEILQVICTPPEDEDDN